METFPIPPRIGVVSAEQGNLGHRGHEIPRPSKTQGRATRMKDYRMAGGFGGGRDEEGAR